MANKEVEDGKICALLAYFFPIGLIWYLADDKMKKNKFAAHHVYQSLTAAIALVIGYVVSSILMVILIGFLLYFLVSIAALVWFIQGIIFSLNGEKKELFLIGKYAKNFKF